MKPSKTPIEALKTRIITIMEKLWLVDDTILVAPYRGDVTSREACLDQQTPLPKSLRELREHFGDVKIKPHGGRTFMDVRIAHTLDWDELRKDARASLEGSDANVWEIALQYPDTQERIP